MRTEVNKIVLDDSIYPRNCLPQFSILRLGHAFDAGAKFPPLTIEARTLRLIDGRQRLEVYKQRGIVRVEAQLKTYPGDAEAFADAVRLNVSHGQPLDAYCIRSAIVRLFAFGLKREAISEIVRIPVEQITKMERGFAQSSETGSTVPLKGGLSHMKGKTLTPEQQNVNRHYGGGNAVFYARQVCNLLESDMWPTESVAFAQQMDHLTELWLEKRRKSAA